MDQPVYAVLIGFLAGALVGLTGLGGGVLMLPLLILGLRFAASPEPGVPSGMKTLTQYKRFVPARSSTR